MEPFLPVFDLSGTLVDTVPDLRAALNQMPRQRGRRSVVAAGSEMQHAAAEDGVSA
ncbi:MAG: hypothetical protein WA633_13935 [Stellaceae bacterium]